MDRYLIESLVSWKNNPRRKPLIINGARQVGKTWLIKNFGSAYFENIAYVSLDNDSIACSIFEQDFNTDRIIKDLSLHTGVQISTKQTLIAIDEIQACPKAITSLKYFCEDAREYPVVAAGSLLGLSAHEGTGYPVGKVDTLNLYPMSFREFLDATDKKALRELLDSNKTDSINIFSSKAISALKLYYVVGGMPAAVSAFSQGASFAEVRNLQTSLLEGYVRDFSKHAPKQIFPKMLELWESIPSHLSHENKKFVFGHIREGARAKDYENALIWLAEAGLITKVSRITKPGIPLSAYNDNKSFKVFLLDVGLLGAMSDLDPKSLLARNSIFTEFKGAFTEQYVCQQLLSDCKMKPYYWSAKNSVGEIDFLVQYSSEIVAIEVKAEENLHSKSLHAFKQKNDRVNSIRFSLSNYREQDWMRNIPLYAISNLSLWGV